MKIVLNKGTSEEKTIQMKRNKPRIVREALQVQKDVAKNITDPDELDKVLEMVCGWFPSLKVVELYDNTEVNLIEFIFECTSYAITGIVKTITDGDEKKEEMPRGEESPSNAI